MSEQNQTICSSPLLNWLERMILKCMDNGIMHKQNSNALKLEAVNFFLEIVNVWGKKEQSSYPIGEPFLLLSFRSKIGQECEHCTLFEVFEGLDFGSSRQKKPICCWCFSMQSSFSSSGGYILLLASHKFLLYDKIPIPSGFEHAGEATSSFLSKLPVKLWQSLASTSCTSRIESGIGKSVVLLTGNTRGSLMVNDKIAEEETRSSFSSLKELLFWKSSLSFAIEHFCSCQQFSEKLQRQSTCLAHFKFLS